jgi:diguanylate cyclase (GGDEF)-like protein
MLDVLRKVGLVARYGGEEFDVVMPHTHLDGALRAGERVRDAVGTYHFDGLRQADSLTVSIGVSTLFENVGMDMDALIKMADDALYKAKVNGRNRVEKPDAPVK